jgi:hypothetical protein
MLLSVPVRTLTDWAAAVYESADGSVHAKKRWVQFSMYLWILEQQRILKRRLMQVV